VCGWMQAHMGRLPLPISDYITDTKTALDNSLRVLQALCDAAADSGYLTTSLAVMSLVQSLLQVKRV
jgi:activating signal cointegrator complex subunit 3